MSSCSLRRRAQVPSGTGSLLLPGRGGRTTLTSRPLPGRLQIQLTVMGVLLVAFFTPQTKQCWHANIRY
jgi:hypothetical protein